MPAKAPMDENIRFLVSCLNHSDYKTIDYHAVGKDININAPAARMRLTRLKRGALQPGPIVTPFPPLSVPPPSLPPTPAKHQTSDKRKALSDPKSRPHGHKGKKSKDVHPNPIDDFDTTNSREADDALFAACLAGTPPTRLMSLTQSNMLGWNGQTGYLGGGGGYGLNYSPYEGLMPHLNNPLSTTGGYTSPTAMLIDPVLGFEQAPMYAPIDFRRGFQGEMEMEGDGKEYGSLAERACLAYYPSPSEDTSSSGGSYQHAFSSSSSASSLARTVSSPAPQKQQISINASSHSSVAPSLTPSTLSTPHTHFITAHNAISPSVPDVEPVEVQTGKLADKAVSDRDENEILVADNVARKVSNIFSAMSEAEKLEGIVDVQRGKKRGLRTVRRAPERLDGGVIVLDDDEDSEESMGSPGDEEYVE